MTGDPNALRIVLLGVAGAGKSTVGRLLAEQFAVPFVDADDLHPAANRQRMARGEPLDDAARRPWLDAVHGHIAALTANASGFVLACSLLKRSYRGVLAQGLPPLTFVHLTADAATLRRRLAARRNHFFPASLLDDQLATWEPLADGLTVDATRAPGDVVANLVDRLRRHPPAGFTRT